uniref:Uncharacterized protein n=1 Tax=Fusarium oxysporum (strain Fo5176) TaxID=660025 RepID=A0A0D2YHQ8_FUSOF
MKEENHATVSVYALQPSSGTTGTTKRLAQVRSVRNPKKHFSCEAQSCCTVASAQESPFRIISRLQLRYSKRHPPLKDHPRLRLLTVTNETQLEQYTTT